MDSNKLHKPMNTWSVIAMNLLVNLESIYFVFKVVPQKLNTSAIVRVLCEIINICLGLSTQKHQTGVAEDLLWLKSIKAVFQ